jgi:hypothetical protein
MHVDAHRWPGLNPRMKAFPILGLALCLTFLAAGCARNYNITTNSGRVITSRGKPHYDKANSVFVFTDARGEQSSIPAGSVRQIAPASDATSTTGFDPKPAR